MSGPVRLLAWPPKSGTELNGMLGDVWYPAVVASPFLVKVPAGHLIVTVKVATVLGHFPPGTPLLFATLTWLFSHAVR